MIAGTFRNIFTQVHIRIVGIIEYDKPFLVGGSKPFKGIIVVFIPKLRVSRLDEGLEVTF